MKRLVYAPALAILFLTGFAGEARAQSFTAFLGGGKEVPPVQTQAKSFAVFRFLMNDRLLAGYRFNFLHRNEEVLMVHIHEAPEGQDGPIVLALKPDAFCLDVGGFLTLYLATAEHLRGSLQGKTLSELKALMTTGNTYLNLHTDPFPDGWIRGQFPARGGT